MHIILFLLVVAATLYTKVNSGAVGNRIQTLELVHVVFRHGDRTPDKFYAPYTPKTFYPEGIGHLTNKGKLTSYNMGMALREKYGKFLGDVFTPEVLYCVASHYPRTKVSIQLVLAGLYPPASIQKWNDHLNWQPIPCDYMKSEDNTLFTPVSTCPNYNALFKNELLQSSSDPIYLKYQHLLAYLREMTGDVDTDLFTLAGILYSTLSAEEEYGLALPSWTKSVYPDIIKDIASHTFKYYTGLGKVKILQPGYLMSQIVNNTYLTINRDTSVNGRKLYLYSGHDINIASILYFLGRSEPRIIEYGSQIIIEVHKIFGKRFFKFLFENFEYPKPEPVYVPNCGYFCPVDVFAKLYANVLDPVQLHNLCYN